MSRSAPPHIRLARFAGEAEPKDRVRVQRAQRAIQDSALCDRPPSHNGKACPELAEGGLRLRFYAPSTTPAPMRDCPPSHNGKGLGVRFYASRIA